MHIYMFSAPVLLPAALADVAVRRVRRVWRRRGLIDGVNDNIEC